MLDWCCKKMGTSYETIEAYCTLEKLSNEQLVKDVDKYHQQFPRVTYFDVDFNNFAVLEGDEIPPSLSMYKDSLVKICDKDTVYDDEEVYEFVNKLRENQKWKGKKILILNGDDNDNEKKFYAVKQIYDAVEYWRKSGKLVVGDVDLSFCVYDDNECDLLVRWVINFNEDPSKDNIIIYDSDYESDDESDDESYRDSDEEKFEKYDEEEDDKC